MKEKNLKKRYVFAVCRHLPEKLRDETSQEISSLIDEMLLARCKEGEPSNEDITAVLLKLGSPESLALKYLGKEDISFISGTSVLLYKKLLFLVLPIVFASVVFGFTLAVLLGEDAAIFSSLFGAILVAMCMAFTAITIAATLFG